MAVLAPLLTVAALALSGWLAFGVVTVRSLATPARIGLLPHPHTILVFVAPLVALAALASLHERRVAVRRGSGDEGNRAVAPPERATLDVALRGDRRTRPTAARLRTVAAIAALLAPLVLPWLPVPLPPTLLVWTGPLAVAWWAVVVAYAYADALRSLLRPLAAVVRSPRRAPVLAALLTGALLAAAAWRTAPQHPRGDEPDYLIITQSLLLDHDLQIENNHARADYTAYHRAPLPPSYLARGTNGAIYSVHAPGLPVMLAPAFAVAGYRGAVATLILFAMAGAWLAWWTAWRSTGDVTASWIATLATVGAAPYFLHAAAIFPDAPASVLALGAVAVLVDRARPSTAAQAGRAVVGPLTSTRGERAPVWPIVAASVALGVLPWLHTRYAVLSVGVGAAMCLQLAARRDWRALVTFVAPAVVLAIAWFAFFLVVYGTPNPSAPYGAYTQMALVHLLPGLPGLLFDQQFGLLANAPVLAAALLAVRPAQREAAPGPWRLAVLIGTLALLYACLVGAYRMWWGGFSAPARFLVPLILPLSPFIALAWQSLRTQASRHMVVALLAMSLALTTLVVCVDHGALAYNLRDGRARWLLWVSPLVDLSGALPAAHRDAPLFVLRDALVWLVVVAGAWTAWRSFEVRGRLTPVVTLLTLVAGVAAASASVWWLHGVNGLAPARSQVQYLTRRAAAPNDVLVAITPPVVRRTRMWFEVELDTTRPRSGADYSVLRLDALPAGRYRLLTDVRSRGARFGVTLGDARSTRFIVDLDTATAHASAAFDLALPVENLVVKSARPAAEIGGRTWLLADEVSPTQAFPPATRAHPMGDGVWLLPEADVYPEPGGVWLAADADVTIGLPSSHPVDVELRAGAADVVVSWSGTGDGEVRLPAGQTRRVTVVPRQGRVQLRTRGGFRPSQVSPGDKDQRYLGVWISVPRQNRATPIT